MCIFVMIDLDLMLLTITGVLLSTLVAGSINNESYTTHAGTYIHTLGYDMHISLCSDINSCDHTIRE